MYMCNCVVSSYVGACMYMSSVDMSSYVAGPYVGAACTRVSSYFGACMFISSVILCSRPYVGAACTRVVSSYVGACMYMCSVIPCRS